MPKRSLISRVINATSLPCLLVALCAFAPQSAQSAPVRSIEGPRHLWVGTVMSGEPGAILRYTLREGLPLPKPDTVIEHYGFFEAVGPHGEMYSLLGRNTFFAFRPGATKPYRRFDIPLDPSGHVVGCAVDSRGDLWVQYTYSSDRRFNRVATYMPPSGIMAFSPRARGHVEPIQIFATPGNPGLAINTKDDMFINAFHGNILAVEELDDILKGPKVAKYYEDGFVNDLQAPIATNGLGDLFVASKVTSLVVGIVVWTPTASPIGYPSNRIGTQFQIASIAAGPHYVYLVAQATNSVFVYHAHESGFQQPFASLPVRYPFPYVVATAI